MDLVPEDLILRFSEFKKNIQKQNFSYGKFWNVASKTFNVELTKNGFLNKGERNYFPAIYEKGKNFNHFLYTDTKKNFKKIKTIRTKEYTEINLKKFCSPKNSNGATYIANNFFDIIDNKIDYVPKKILEIGAGSGVLSSILKNEYDSQITIIDIPLVLTCSIAFLMYVFPEKTFCLPNEIGNKELKNFDFIFLFPQQLKYLNKSDEQDLIINSQSFMEMDYKEVDDYFNFINKKVKNNGYFFCSNRTRKINKFFDYPWFKLNNFKKIHIAINKTHKVMKGSTIIDFLLRKNINQTYKKNNLTFLERLYYKNYYFFIERIFWLKVDFKIYTLVHVLKKLTGRKI